MAIKMMTLSFLIIYMLLPFVGDIVEPWGPAAVVAAGGLAVGAALGRGRSILKPMRFHQEYWMGAAAALLLILALKGNTAAEDGGRVLAYLGLSMLLFYVMRGQDTIRMAQFDFVFYVGSALLTLYLVSYAVAIDMLLVPACVLRDQTVTNALALVNGMIAVWGFCREKERIRRVTYGAGGALAFFVIALNDTPGMMLLLLVGIYAFVLTVPPGTEYVKRALSLFVGAAFLACNLSLIVDYTMLFKLNGLSYSLQGGVAAELLLSAFALYVVSMWDRMKENGELNKKGLSMLQKKLGRLAVFAGKLFLVFLIFCGIHLWVGLDQFMMLFWGDKWAGMQEGFLVSVWVQWTVKISGALAGLWNGSLLALCFRSGGAAGLLLGTAAAAWTLWQVWRGLRAGKNMRLVTIVCGEIGALLLLMSVCVELLPFYAVWIDLLICGLQPKQGRKIGLYFSA